MALTIPQLEPLVQADYDELCQAVALRPVPLDIYEILEGSNELRQERGSGG